MTPDKSTPTSAIHQRLMQLFEDVMDLPPGERDALLDRECAGDPQMRARVEALLHADTAFGDAGFTGAIGEGLDALVKSTEPIKAGTRIGAYQIVETLGRGGMGMVFLAERADKQFTQRVAIKVVSGLALNDEIIGRFRSERQILARLEHPYIAHLVDGGETASGVPYLVMEYIEGEPILQACRRLNLDLDARLDIFLQICEAVQFAHQNLIVHRDLKPANIMLSGDGFPKLLDFGIAKILDKRQFEQTMIETQDGQLLFTPDHAAPEQVTGRAITTATDIYCLGILLYELLTGRRPFDLKDRRPGQMEKIICEQAPLLPSALADTIARGSDKAQAGGELTSLPIPADRLRRRLRGDLDNVILKALRKEPERRYPSVAAFAEDIRRHRSGLPVSARPDTWRYRASKFVQRNAIGVAATATVFVLLVAFGITMTVQAARIEREKQTAEQVAYFLVDLIRRQDPKNARGKEFSAVDLLDQWSQRIDTELRNQPEIQTTLKNTIGVAYTNLGAYDSAEAALIEALVQRRKLMRDDPDALARNHNDLGDVFNTQSRYTEALAEYEAALAVARSELDPDHAENSRALSGIGLTRIKMRDYDAAEPPIREAVAIDRRAMREADDTRLAASLTGLGTILWRHNDLAMAEKMFQDALAIRRRALGNDHPDTMVSVNNLATVLVERGDLSGAEPLFVEALQMNERLLGDSHAEIAVNLNNLGYVQLTQGRFEEAEHAYRRSLAIDKAALGDTHPDLAYDMNSLAMTLFGLDRLDEAAGLYRDALALIASQQHEHRLKGQVLANYAALQIARGNGDAAIAMATEARTLIAAEFPQGHWRNAFADSVLGAALAGAGRKDEARPLLEGSIAPIVDSMGPDSIYARDAKRRLAALD